ncbi:hypothetical protein [Bosea minatitlanensis]|uniref:Uncharacterized protein n=1 Tax=Bosea minatitlanensis TaxID=128782 RepID=A0ABW0F1Y9_9HYPH|nr:hypothetical protein [Bosea minatitlanensis]MCT4493946.1 hypothetical protein [Bosea minatitlanensis]
MAHIYDSMAWHVLDTSSISGLDWGYAADEWREEYEILSKLNCLEIDPTGSSFWLTDLGAWFCENLQCGWPESDRSWENREPEWRAKRAYARHRGCTESTVRRACKGRLAMAVVDGRG